ncbi:MAG: DUF2239 family protein [Myxococcales bacterium]|nr:DUF2239 family protein [Myxococcales bacterium]
MDTPRSYASFASKVRIASGDLVSVLTKTKARIDEGEEGPILIFENETGRQVDFDFSGTVGEVIERVAPARAQVGPGRPKLGVVSREVSLLPAHWEWLEAQPQGISGALRRLVQEARRDASGAEQERRAREAAGRFMWSLAGDLPGFEEASRALYAKDDRALARLTARWPADVREHVLRLAGIEPAARKATTTSARPTAAVAKPSSKRSSKKPSKKAGAATKKTRRRS